MCSLRHQAFHDQRIFQLFSHMASFKSISIVFEVDSRPNNLAEQIHVLLGRILVPPVPSLIRKYCMSSGRPNQYGPITIKVYVVLHHITSYHDQYILLIILQSVKAILLFPVCNYSNS